MIIISLLNEVLLIFMHINHNTPVYFVAEMKKQGFGEESELIMVFPDPG